MGWQIIKQPNGKFCIYSSVVDNMTYYNATPEQIVNVYLDEATRGVRERVLGIIMELEQGKKPHGQFTKDFNQMMSWIKEVHGKKECDKILKMINE